MNKSKEEWEEVRKRMLENDEVESIVFMFMDTLTAQIINKTCEEIERRFKEKATLIENSIECGEEPPIDGSFYQIYRGYFEDIINNIQKQ